MKPIDLSRLLVESWDRYHSMRPGYLSSHALADFRRSPRLFKRKMDGLIPDKDTPAFLVGRAAHTLILEGSVAFSDAYATGGPVNPKTGNAYGATTKAWKEWESAQGRPVLTDSQHALILNLWEGVKENDLARDMLRTGAAELVTRHTIDGLPCQARFDWLAPEVGLVDLKTCDDLGYFEFDARRYGYVFQMAFYRMMLRETMDETYPVYIIAVEKREPYRCGVFRIGEGALGEAETQNRDAMTRLIECGRSGRWPTGYEDLRTIDTL